MKKLYPIFAILSCLLVFASCRPQARSFKVTFMNEEEVFAMQEAEEGETLDLSSLTFAQGTPEKEADENYSYVFSGWSLLPNGTKFTHLQVTRDVTLYALYERTSLKPLEEEFTVTFVTEEDGVKRTISTQKVKKGERAIPPAAEEIPTPEGHTFSGWDKDPQTTVIEGRTEFKALFEKSRYSLTKHLLGATDALEVEYGEEIAGVPDLPSVLIFEGWFSDETFGTEFTERTMPAHDLDLYAKVGIDLSEARISGNELVYGARVSVSGLKEAQGLTYTFEWEDGSTEESHELSSAGEVGLSVTVKADYRGVVRAEKTLRETFSVAKKQISGTLTIESPLVYGREPQPHAEFEGSGEEISPTFRYYDEEGKEQNFPLPAGNYTVKAEWDSQNYAGEPLSASLEVTKKPLSAEVSAEDIVYGESPVPQVHYRGLIEGETESVLDQKNLRFVYQKGGTPYAGERFTAGEYTLSAEGVSADNYELSYSSGTFTVSKAPMELTVETAPQIVYGESLLAQVNHSPFVYADETVESVFKKLEAKVSASEPLPAGEYSAEAEYDEPENYAVTAIPARFTVLPKQVAVSLASSSSTYAEQAVLPEPAVEGLLPQDGALAEQMRFRLTVNGEEVGQFLSAGKYRVDLSLENEEEFPNYSFRLGSGELTVAKRTLAILSGEVSRNRDSLWSITPTLSGAEAALFEIEGTLILSTREAGVYRATKENELGPNHFLWSPALRITRRGENVTQNFAVTYDLNVTLNNSRFNVIVPSTGLSFVYDGTEHTFEVEARPIGGDELTPTVRYSVNGGDKTETAPALKNAGRYAVSCEISGENYETEERSFTVEISKARYTVSGAKPLTEKYDGNAHGKPLTVSGVAGEDVSESLHVRISYTPYFGAGGEVVGFSNIVNAGRYAINYSVNGDPNYEDIPQTGYTVTVGRLSYEVEAEEEQRFVYAPRTPHGKGIKVKNVIAGNEYTVSYSHNGKESSSAPVFTDATAGETVAYSVSEGVNYEKKQGSYRVIVGKAQGTLDTGGVVKHYVYNGSEQRVEGGATSNNTEDGEIEYLDNTFTTVAEGNALAVRVKLKEGKNYTGTEETVTGFTVEKQTLSSLPDGVSAEVGEQVNRMGKTLEEVPLPQNFRWKEYVPLSIGERSYDAIYLGNENVNDFPLEINFSTRKERCTVTISGGEGEFRKGASKEEYTLAVVGLTGEDGQERAEETEYLSSRADGGKIDLTRGGTYPVTCTVSVTPNDYFEAEGKTETVPFKLKSVKYGEELYTVEDALLKAQSGIVTVKFDTSFLKEDARTTLNDPYSDPACHTIRQGVTLLVPYSESDAGNTAQTSKQQWSKVTQEGYATLTLPRGTELLVEGNLTVNGLRSSDSQRTSMIVGANHGDLYAESGAKITVKEGGIFESMGFSYGEGEAVVESGGQVFEPFAMVGWKGGSISAAIRNDVFPLNQYALTSLVLKTTFRAGAKYSVRASLTATLSILGGEKNLDLAVSFVGTDSGSFLELREGEIVKSVDEERGKICFGAAGDVTFHNLELRLNDTIRFDTGGLQVPVPGNFEIRILPESHASVPEKVALKLLPGADVKVEKGAELKIETGGALLGYGKNTLFDSGLSAFQDGGNGFAYPHAMLGGAYRKSVGDFGYHADSSASLSVGGTLKVMSGGTLAAEISGEEDAVLELSQGCLLEKKIKEDKTPAITSTTDKLKALSGKGGVFFEATLATDGLSAGKNYLFRGGSWEEQT